MVAVCENAFTLLSVMASKVKSRERTNSLINFEFKRELNLEYKDLAKKWLLRKLNVYVLTGIELSL